MFSIADITLTAFHRGGCSLQEYPCTTLYMYLCTHIPLQRLIKIFKSCLVKHKSCQKRGFARGKENALKKKKTNLKDYWF